MDKDKEKDKEKDKAKEDKEKYKEQDKKDNGNGTCAFQLFSLTNTTGHRHCQYHHKGRII